jgi:hypothetical protein
MKTILCICVLLFSGVLAGAQPADAVREIELSKVSRGYEEHIRITADSLHVFTEGRTGNKPSKNFSRKVMAEEWAAFVKTIKALSLKDLPALPSPTMKRAQDAAMHSTITIQTADGRSFAHGYDDEDPHQALKPLLKQIRALSGAQE